MDECSIKSTQTYMEFKGELDYELNRAANGFVRIGYLLRKARDTDVLKDSPYTNVNDFAREEYGLDTSQVSRFININEKFARADDPEQLKDEYKGYGVAKLGLMLTLPGPIVEELSPEMSKTEIQTVKEEYEAEQKITPIEVMTEDKNDARGFEDFSLLAKVLYMIGESEPKMMAALMKEEAFTINPDPRREMGILAPAGQKMYIARIQGMGKYSLNIKGTDATLIDMREGCKSNYTAKEVSEALLEVIDSTITEELAMDENGIRDEKEMWTILYGKEFPEIAPVQKESRVSTTKTEKNDKKRQKTAKKDEDHTLPAKSGNEMSENDQVMNEPEDSIPAAEEAETLPESSAEPEEIKPAIDKATLRGYKAGLKSDAHTCERLIDDNQFRALRTKLQSMLNTVGRIIDALEGTDDE